MKEQKVSLHASGKQHISFSQEFVARVSSTGDRFMNQWWEPQHVDRAVPTLRLLFPTWGLSLNNQQREKFQTLWDKNDIWIPAHDEMVTVVSFLIIDNGTILRKEEAWPPAAVIGILKLQLGKSLFLIAGYEPEGNLREKVENALRKTSVTTDPTLLKGKDLALCFTGWYQDNSAYMLTVSARYDLLAQPDSI